MRSRKAVEKLGATLEGDLRKDILLLDVLNEVAVVMVS